MWRTNRSFERAHAQEHQCTAAAQIGQVSASLYLTSLEPGLLDRLTESPQEIPCCRTVGRPAEATQTSGANICIYWPMAEHGRIRRILSRSGVRRRYCIPCFRGVPRDAHVEAAEEARSVVLLDACPGVEFQEHPARIEFELGGETYSHFPDILVCARAMELREFWECKRDHEVEDIFIRIRARRLTELLEPLGYGYRLVSTSCLQKASYYENAITLRRDAAALQLMHDSVWTHREIAAAVDACVAGKPLDARHGAGAAAQQHALLYLGKLSADLAMPLCEASAFWLPKGDSKPWVWELFERSS